MRIPLSRLARGRAAPPHCAAHAIDPACTAPSSPSPAATCACSRRRRRSARTSSCSTSRTPSPPTTRSEPGASDRGAARARLVAHLGIAPDQRPRHHWCYRDVVDVAEQAGDRLDTVLIPKVACAGDVHFVATLLEQIEAAHGLPRPIRISVLIETAAGMHRVDEIAAACPERMEAMVFGVADYAASIRSGQAAAISSTPVHAGERCRSARLIPMGRVPRARPRSARAAWRRSWTSPARPDLRDRRPVEPVAGLLGDIDDVAVAPVRVEAVDPEALPSMRDQSSSRSAAIHLWPRARSLSSGATASSRSSMTTSAPSRRRLLRACARPFLTASTERWRRER